MSSSLFLPLRAERIFWERSNIPTVVSNTDFVASSEYTLPPNKMSKNGDILIIEAKMSYTTGAAENKNLRANIGQTAGSFVASSGTWTGGLGVIAESTASSSANISWWVRAYLTRLSATSVGYQWLSLWHGADVSQSAMYTVNTSALTWANPLPIQVAIGNVTASNTTVLTLQEFSVAYDPYNG